jgi:hypothetical protein
MTVSETSPAPGGLANPIPLSLNQEFLCAFDKGDDEGAFSDRHTLVNGWRVRGPIDIGTLQGALEDVVARHEALRTEIVHADGPRYQQIHQAHQQVRLLVRDLSGVEPHAREVRAEELVNEVDAARYNVRELPLLRAVLGRFGDDDAVLVLSTHHTATDAWSMQVIARDVAACYAARTGHRPAAPPACQNPVCQYQEFAVWQQDSLGSAAVDTARGYWRDTLRDARILALPTDRPRPDGIPNTFAVHRFLIEAELTSATLRFANAVRSSPFMILLAAFNVLLQRRTGCSDVVVPTFTSGRYQERFLDTVGPFFNFVPLRTDLATCATFREVAARTRTTCLEAYANDIPFGLVVQEAPDLIGPFADPGRTVVAFELLQSSTPMEGELIGGLEYSEIRRRLLSQPVAADIPDGALWAIDVLPSGDMVGSLKFNSNLFDESTMTALAAEYRQVLRDCVTAPDAPLPQA